MNIFISNLNYRVVESELQALFENYGVVDSVKIITDRETGRSRGFSFVEMPNDEEAEEAIEELNQSDFKGRDLNVSQAKPREDRSRRGGFDNRSNDRRRDW